MACLYSQYNSVRCTIALLIAYFSFLMFAAPQHIKACEDSTIRDAAFLEERDIHRLCVIAESTDQQAWEIYDKLESWFLQNGEALNIDLYKVEGDSQNIPWNEYGIPSAPPSMPVVVLSGYHRVENRTFFIHHWKPLPDEKSMKAIQTSPVRELLRNELGKKLAIFLYVPGTSGKSVEKLEVIVKVIDRWNRKNALDISMLSIQRNNEQEKLLLAFMGIQDEGPEWVGIVFGKGTLMFPPLRGDEITEYNLEQQLEILLLNCSCLRSASSLGVNIPMIWNQEQTKNVIPTVAKSEDKNNPVLVSSLANSRESEGKIFSAVAWSMCFVTAVVFVTSVVLLWVARTRPRSELLIWGIVI